MRRRSRETARSSLEIRTRSNVAAIRIVDASRASCTLVRRARAPSPSCCRSAARRCLCRSMSSPERDLQNPALPSAVGAPRMRNALGSAWRDRGRRDARRERERADRSVSRTLVALGERERLLSCAFDGGRGEREGVDRTIATAVRGARRHAAGSAHGDLSELRRGRRHARHARRRAAHRRELPLRLSVRRSHSCARGRGHRAPRIGDERRRGTAPPGGIMDGTGIARALAIGASGAQLGTRAMPRSGRR